MLADKRAYENQKKASRDYSKHKYEEIDSPIAEVDEESKEDNFGRMTSGEMYRHKMSGQSGSSDEYYSSNYCMALKNNTSRENLGVIDEEVFSSFTLIGG